MSEPWFDGMRYGWLPGTLLGVLGGTWGGLIGTLAPRGKARGLVLGGMWAMLGASALLLAAGVFGWASGQPYAVWYGLGLAGFIGVLVIGLNIPTVRRAYRMAEERRMAVEDARGV